MKESIGLAVSAQSALPEVHLRVHEVRLFGRRHPGQGIGRGGGRRRPGAVLEHLLRRIARSTKRRSALT